MKLFILRAVLALFSSCAAVSVTGQALAVMTDLLDDNDLQSATLGIYAKNLKTGEVLLSHEADRSVVPASVMKLVTTAAVLRRFGPEYRFSTTLARMGKIVDGRLEGNLLVIGGGDPSLGMKNIANSNPVAGWVRALDKADIQKVTGNVVAVDTIFDEQQIPDTWIWEDMGNYYGTGAAGLNYAGNRIDLEFATAKPGSPARLLPGEVVNGLEFVSTVKASTDNRDRAYIFGAPEMHRRKIRGTLPAHKKKFKIHGSIPDPLEFSAQQIATALENAGLEIQGKTSYTHRLNNAEPIKTIAVHRSARLKRLVKYTNHESDNLFAEVFLRMLAVHEGDTGSYKNALPRLKTFMRLKHIDISGFFPADGSGLSRFTSVTAHQLVGLLQAMRSDENFKVYKNSLLKIGQEQLFGRGTAAAGRGRAKSGYMERVRSYAGYLNGPDGSTIAFALVANNFSCTPAAMRVKWSKLAGALAAGK